MKKIDQMYVLLAICLTLYPQVFSSHSHSHSHSHRSVIIFFPGGGGSEDFGVITWFSGGKEGNWSPTDQGGGWGTGQNWVPTNCQWKGIIRVQSLIGNQVKFIAMQTISSLNTPPPPPPDKEWSDPFSTLGVVDVVSFFSVFLIKLKKAHNESLQNCVFVAANWWVCSLTTEGEKCR